MYEHITKRNVRIYTALTFLVMIAVNTLANVLPLFGVTTGQVSDSYPNLFAPAGYTFSIWGLIYFLLLAHTLYQLWLFKRGRSKLDTRTLDRIGILFCISSLANTLWIVCWHARLIPVTMVLTIVMLVCVATIVSLLHDQPLTRKERLFVRLPFSVYFGWLTVATIANMTTMMVYFGWNGFGLSSDVWMMIVSTIGALIAIAVVLLLRDGAYGLVIVWAYAGILYKHLSPGGFGGTHVGVIVVVSVLIALIALSLGYLLYRRQRNA